MSDTKKLLYLLHCGDILLISHFWLPHHFTLQHVEVRWAPWILGYILSVSGEAMISVCNFKLLGVQDVIRVRLQSSHKLSELGEGFVL